MANEVKKYTYPLHTEYRICGTAEYVDAKIRKLVQDYPPAGYGTRTTHYGLAFNGSTVAHVKRDNSCD